MTKQFYFAPSSIIYVFSFFEFVILSWNNTHDDQPRMFMNFALKKKSQISDDNYICSPQFGCATHKCSIFLKRNFFLLLQQQSDQIWCAMMDASVYKRCKDIFIFFHLVTNYFFPRGLSKLWSIFKMSQKKIIIKIICLIIRRNYLLLCIFCIMLSIKVVNTFWSNKHTTLKKIRRRRWQTQCELLTALAWCVHFY